MRHYTGALLQGKIGPLALRDTLQLFRSDLSVHGGDTVYYDAITDMLVPAHGWFFTNDADAIVIVSPHLYLGLRHSLAQAFGLDISPQHRLGPLVVWRLFEAAAGTHPRFDGPSIVVLLQWQLWHPYRVGQEIAQALPLMALGFAFNGDLLP